MRLNTPEKIFKNDKKTSLPSTIKSNKKNHRVKEKENEGHNQIKEHDYETNKMTTINTTNNITYD